MTFVKPNLTVVNNMKQAGQQVGQKFVITPEERLKRFLVLGVLGSTVRADSKAGLTAENMINIINMVKYSPNEAVALAVKMSEEGRVIKNDTCLLVLAIALAHGDLATKRLVRQELPKVARIGTDILHFVKMLDSMRGWGRLAKKAVADWYLSKTPDKLAYQIAKYKQRDGWSHRDVLRVSHPNPSELSTASQSVFQYVVKGYDGVEHKNVLPSVLGAMEDALTAPIPKLVQLITDFRLSHEMIPNESKSDPKVWEALLPSMGVGAMVRNLGKMTSIGLLAPLSDASKFVCTVLGDISAVAKSRIHPMQILTAWEIYRRGAGMKGSLTWKPNAAILAKLEDAFYSSFHNIVPSKKNMFLAIDVSGSMTSPMTGDTPVTCAQGAALMAMVTARTEPWTAMFGFKHTLVDLGIGPNDRFDVVQRKVQDHNFGSTDCGAPMRYANQANMPVDAFSVYTDNETYAGPVAPVVELQRYREKSGRNAKLIVVGMRTTGFSIADPNDPGMLDLVGFDTATPQVISEFVLS